MKQGSFTTWTPDRKALALQMWAEGQSAAAIARRVGGVSRNAVIGLVTRARASRGTAAPRPPHDPCERFSDRALLEAPRVRDRSGSASAVARSLGCKWATAKAVLARLDADYRESLT